MGNKLSAQKTYKAVFGKDGLAQQTDIFNPRATMPALTLDIEKSIVSDRKTSSCLPFDHSVSLEYNLQYHCKAWQHFIRKTV